MNKRGLSNLVDRGKSVWRDWMKTESALQQKEGGGRTETHHQFLTRQLTLTPKKFRSWMESSCWLSIFPPVFFLFTRPLLLRRNNKFQLRFDSPPPPSLDRAARKPKPDSAHPNLCAVAPPVFHIDETEAQLSNATQRLGRGTLQSKEIGG